MRFLKVGRRNALSIARLSMAAIARQQFDGQIALIRLVAGACFARPQRAHEIEALLLGQQPTPALFEEAGQLLAQQMVDETGQRWSTPYKSLALAALVAETLEQVIASEGMTHAVGEPEFR
jgi:CO/xanthine dehydrogenase FAD-binding subunit